MGSKDLAPWLRVFAVDLNSFLVPMLGSSSYLPVTPAPGDKSFWSAQAVEFTYAYFHTDIHTYN